MRDDVTDQIPYIFKVPACILAKPSAEMEKFGSGREPLIEVAKGLSDALFWLEPYEPGEFISRTAHLLYKEIDEIFERFDNAETLELRIFWEYGASQKFTEWTKINTLALSICKEMGWDEQDVPDRF